MKNKHLRVKPLAITMGIALFLFSTAFVVNNVKNTNGKESANTLQAENEYLTSLRVNPATGTVTPADYQKAYNEVMKFRKQSLTKSTNSADLTWTACGPDNLSGRMRSIVYFNGYWYAGSPDGGLWRTSFSQSATNNYVWSKVNSDIYDISCMYVDGNTLYIGTGEGFYSENFNLLPGFRGVGIWKTTDGTSFTCLESTVPSNISTSNNDWFYISKITKSHSKLFAATNTGLQVSDDNGETWNKIFEGDCSDVTSQDGIILTFVDGLAYISTNGTDFTCISTNYYDGNTNVNPTMLPRDSVGRITFAIAPSNNKVIYATAIWKYNNPATPDYDEVGSLKNIYSSQDGGNSWTLIGPGDGWTMFHIFNGNGLYSTAMIVDPNNPDRVFVGGMDLWEGSKVAGNNIYKWTQRTSAENATARAYVPQNHFQYLFTNTEFGETIVIACENGIYFSYKQGALSRSSSCNINLMTTQFYTVASSYNDNLMGGSQGNGTVAISKASYSGMNGTNLHRSVLGALTGNDYTFDNIGGYCHYSMIYPTGQFASINGHNDLKDESQTAYSDFSGNQYLILYRFDDQVPQDISYWYSSDYFKAIEDSASYITPSILWEDFDWEFSRDSVAFSDTISHKAGDVVYAESSNASYPIPYTLEEDLPANSSIMIQDKVSSRFFVGVNNLIFMTKYATDFNIDFETADPWWIISSRDLGGVSGTPQCMATSKDCNYLFVGTKDGKLYKISNIAYAQDAKSGRACTYNAAFSTCTPNPYCLINTTLLETPFTEGRVITSVAVNPNDPNIVVITLGNYGCEDYIYITENAISQHPTFRKVDFLDIPVYTACFIENDEDLDNMLLIGSDFGIYEYEDVVNSDVYTPQFTGMDNVPVFMIKQQNINTVCDIINDEPVYRPVYAVDHENETTDTTYITSYRNIYVATYGGGLFKCTQFNKQNKNVNNPTGISNISSADNNIYVYPNPVIDNANISINTRANALITVNIYNMSGAVVRSTSFNSGNGIAQCSISTDGLPTGTYIIRAITPSGTSSSKFVVVK